MIPLAVPNLTGHEGRYLQECIETSFVSSVGPFVPRFEGMVAAAAASPYAVATSAGTTGLHAALTAVGVSRDDLVVLPSFTFIASANAIAHCGAMPWLFDIAADSWTIDASLLAERLDAETRRIDGRLIHVATGRRVAAIVPVYTLGTPADMDAIVGIARRFELPVVADGAAALGATYCGRRPGRLGADLTVYSFNGNKTVTAGGGGVVAGDASELLTLVRHLTTTARIGEDYTHDRVGFNYRMTNLAAAVGCAQMERLDEFVAAKRRIRRTYDDAFANTSGITSLPNPDWAESASWLSGVLLDTPLLAEVIRADLRTAGVDARPFWKPIHLQCAFLSAPATPQVISTELWQRVVTLPCSSDLTDADQGTVIEAVRTALRSRRA